MSLSRLWLRCLAVAALQKQAYDQYPPTMAGEYVFDSRIDPIAFDAETKELPAVIVYTSDDTSTLLNPSGLGGEYRKVVDLIVELSVGTFDTVVIDNKEHKAYALPVTDAQLEARLDMFEVQVKRALFGAFTRQITSALNLFVVRVHSITSHATRDEANNKLASRVLTFQCEIKDDCDFPYATAAPEKTEFDLSQFPGQPWLGDMLTALQNDPGMKPVVDALAGNFNSAIVVPLLKRIGMTADFIDPYDKNKVPGEPHRGPDGVVDHTIMVKMENQ